MAIFSSSRSPHYILYEHSNISTHLPSSLLQQLVQLLPRVGEGEEEGRKGEREGGEEKKKEKEEEILEKEDEEEERRNC